MSGYLQRNLTALIDPVTNLLRGFRDGMGNEAMVSTLSADAPGNVQYKLRQLQGQQLSQSLLPITPYIAYIGTVTTTNTSSTTVNALGANWATNQWAGYTFIDTYTGVTSAIASNTLNTLTLSTALTTTLADQFTISQQNSYPPPPIITQTPQNASNNTAATTIPNGITIYADAVIAGTDTRFSMLNASGWVLTATSNDGHGFYAVPLNTLSDISPTGCVGFYHDGPIVEIGNRHAENWQVFIDGLPITSYPTFTQAGSAYGLTRTVINLGSRKRRKFLCYGQTSGFWGIGAGALDTVEAVDFTKEIRVAVMSDSYGGQNGDSPVWPVWPGWRGVPRQLDRRGLSCRAAFDDCRTLTPNDQGLQS